MEFFCALQFQDKTQRPVVLRKRRQRVKSSVNWKMFCYQFGNDHCKVCASIVAFVCDVQSLILKLRLGQLCLLEFPEKSFRHS